jgi:hypothetical protein
MERIKAMSSYNLSINPFSKSWGDGHKSHPSYYSNALKALPPPGSGGFHTGIMKVAILGFRAGIDRQQIHSELRSIANQGSRHVPERELIDTLDNATAEVASHKLARKNGFDYEATTTEGIRACEAFIAVGRGITEADIIKASPVDVTNLTPWDFIRHLYGLEEMIFIGDRHETSHQNISAAKAWYNRLRYGSWTLPPHIIPNPLTGKQGLLKNSTGTTLRGDSCVKSLRYCVAEFDSLPRDAQLSFWAAANLPVAALIDSGGKSIHAWLRVDCGSTDEWEEKIVRKLYGDILIPMGVDRNCRNPSRLSRMPGHLRHRDDGTTALQRCIYLAPQGRAVMAGISECWE